MSRIDFSQLKNQLQEIINSSSSIGILTHKNPDGDGLPAALALQEILQQLGRQAEIILEYPAPDQYDFLEAASRTRVFSEHHYYKNLIIVDCHEEERVRNCAPLIPTADKIVAIDHHQQGKLIENAKTYIDTAAVSAGAILYRLFAREIEQFPSAATNYIATAFYTTIVNDTDNFLNRNVDAETFQVCQELMQYQIVPGEITEQFLLSKPAATMAFVGDVLATIDTYDQDKILFIHFTREMMAARGVGNEATSKLIRWVKGTENMMVAVSFQEINENRYRLSMRSNYINVNKICVKYGGGGHQKASGCEIKGSLDELKKLILADIRPAITEFFQ
ncbi:MAG: DHH family phosphoesterase [Candidatus Cloacimonadales bacterium]